MSHNLHNSLRRVLARPYGVSTVSRAFAAVRAPGATGALGVFGTASVLLAVAAGCQGNAAKTHGENFSNHEVQCAAQRIAEVQAAAGARADAMLHLQHFDGETLNSLGQHKLDLMIQDERSITPLTVYLDFAETDARDEMRRRSVVMYLRERGLLESQIKLESGVNPGALTAALPNLTRLPKTENPGEGEAAGAPAPAAGMGMGMSGGLSK